MVFNPLKQVEKTSKLSQIFLIFLNYIFNITLHIFTCELTRQLAEEQD